MATKPKSLLLIFLAFQLSLVAPASSQQAQQSTSQNATGTFAASSASGAASSSPSGAATSTSSGAARFSLRMLLPGGRLASPSGSTGIVCDDSSRPYPDVIDDCGPR